MSNPQWQCRAENILDLVKEGRRFNLISPGIDLGVQPYFHDMLQTGESPLVWQALHWSAEHYCHCKGQKAICQQQCYRLAIGPVVVSSVADRSRPPWIREGQGITQYY